MRRLIESAICVSLITGVAWGCGGSGGESGAEKRAEASEEPRESASESDDSGATTDQRSESESEDSDDGSKDIPFYASGPVAKVDGTTISAERFNEFVRDKLGNRRLPPRTVRQKVKKQLLTGVISQHLLDREIQEAGIEVTNKELDERVSELRDRFPSKKKFEQYKQERGWDEDDLRRKVRKEIKLRKLVEQNKDVEVTDEDVKSHYESNKPKYTRPERVKASQILIKPESEGGKDEAKKKAEELMNKAKGDDEKFAELARQHSDGPAADKGGDLGFFPRKRMPKPFSKKVFSMENGEIAGPVETDFGYHVIKRTGHEPEKTEEFSEVEDDIRKRLERQRMKQATRGYIDEIRKNADIEKMPENIEAAEREGTRKRKRRRRRQPGRRR